MSPNQDTQPNHNQFLSKDQFVEWVRDALKSLYDSPYLASHPLVDLLVQPENRTSRRSQDLRKVLVSAIQAMKPGKNHPPDSRDWRSFLILEQRFIVGQTTAEVQQQLNISRSLMYQEQAYALETLVNRLWDTYAANLSLMDADISTSLSSKEQTPDTEILRLLADANWEKIDVNSLIRDLQPMMSALINNSSVSLVYHLEIPIIVPIADRVLMRMLLMGLIGDLVQNSTDAIITLSTFSESRQKGLHISRSVVPQKVEYENPASDERFSTETYNRLMRAMGGELKFDTSNPGERWLVWDDTLHQQTLMLIDDHLEIEELFNRYLSGSNWRVVAAPSGESARKLLETIKPDVIFLDVILPQEDGWELLQAFRVDPQMIDIPIIVCSVIYEPHLLETLGATEYMSKPVTQTELYRMLRKVLPVRD